MTNFFKLALRFTVATALLLNVSEMTAQTRKSTTTKKTTAKTAVAKDRAKTVILDGNFYEGILKLQGQPMDFFSSLSFDATNVTFNFAGAMDFPATYTASESAGTTTLKLTSQAASGTLTSKDKGSSFEGTINMNGKMLKAWFLKVNPQHIVPSISDEELAAVIGSPDGYTAFVVGEQGGQKVCFTADMNFKKEDNSFAVTFDNPIVQKIFSNMQGTFNVKDHQLVLKDSTGITKSGSIYDDGTYITLPMGSGQGFNFTLLMIR